MNNAISLRQRIENFILSHLNEGHSIFLTDSVKAAMSLSPQSMFTNMSDPAVERLLTGQSLIISWSFPFKTIIVVSVKDGEIRESEEPSWIL